MNRWRAVVLAMLLAACAASRSDLAQECAGGKCDDPAAPPTESRRTRCQLPPTDSPSDWVDDPGEIEFVSGTVDWPVVYDDRTQPDHGVDPPTSSAESLRVLGIDPDTLEKTAAYPSSRAQWEGLRDEVIAAVNASLGDWPCFPRKVVVQIVSSSHHVAASGAGYTRTRFRFHNGADAVVPGILFTPDQAAQDDVPLVLYCHYHGAEYDIGLKSLHVHGRNWPRSNEHGDFEETRDVSPEWLGDWPDGVDSLAELYMLPGYAVMSIDEYGFNERQGRGPNGPDEVGGDEIDAFEQMFRDEGRTRFGMGVRDKQMALEWVSRQPGIDRSRRSVTGMSMGSWSSMQMAFAEPTLDPVIAVAGLFETDAPMIAALAPDQRVLTLNGDRDPGNAPVVSVELAAEVIEHIYGLFDRVDAYDNAVIPELGHEMTIGQTLAALDAMAAGF